VGAADERSASIGDVELCYEELGDPGGEPMLLVMGLGAQMILWDRAFCDLLGERGYRVIRFDNRDVGRSTHLRAPVPSRTAMLFGRGRPAYRLGDMAADAVGLLDALDIESAHVVGASMGGMITQVVGYEHPERARSLGLIMTHSGHRVKATPTWRAFGALLARPASDREGMIESMQRVFKIIGSPDYPMDPAQFRALAEVTWERGYDAAGTARQLHAITASGNRTRRLAAISAPTVVVHGTRDPLVRPSNGKLIARTIPGADLLLLDGMGHDLPEPLWPRIIDAVDRNAKRALAPVAA
jgi:pimeloyl-ACP methyl ester carboxylesterase